MFDFAFQNLWALQFQALYFNKTCKTFRQSHLDFSNHQQTFESLHLQRELHLQIFIYIHVTTIFTSKLYPLSPTEGLFLLRVEKQVISCCSPAFYRSAWRSWRQKSWRSSRAARPKAMMERATMRRQRRSERSGARGRRRAKGNAWGEMMGKKRAQRWMIVVYYCHFAQVMRKFLRVCMQRSFVWELDGVWWCHAGMGRWAFKLGSVSVAKMHFPWHINFCNARWTISDGDSLKISCFQS